MNQCDGIVVSKTSENYGKQCSLFTDGIYCDYHGWQQNIEKHCIKRIKLYLESFESAKGKTAKIKICEPMFNFLAHNKKFIHDYQKFANIVHEKLKELNPDWPRAEHYIKIIFEEE
jgi:hypothetical protein